MGDIAAVGIHDGVSRAGALEAFERLCNKPYKTLWITESWFAVRRQALLEHLGDPIDADETEALRAALRKEEPLDGVIEWLEADRRESWSAFRERSREAQRRELIEPMRRRYLEAERQLWAGRKLATLAPPATLERLHWFCAPSQPSRRDTAFRADEEESLGACPSCGKQASELEWRCVELVSPIDGAVEDRGWLAACDPCRLIVHNVFPRAERRWQLEMTTDFSLPTGY